MRELSVLSSGASTSLRSVFWKNPIAIGCDATAEQTRLTTIIKNKSQSGREQNDKRSTGSSPV